MRTARSTTMRHCLQHEVACFNAARHAQVSVDAPGPGPQVTVQLQSGIRSFVRELVHRAHERNPRGQVRIGLRQRKLPAKAISWVVFVEDSGPGPSLQLDKVTCTDPGFPGWLDALAQRVDAIGGRLRAQGVGQGSVVWFSLPEELFAEGDAPGRVEDRIRGSRVLVVDDNVVNSRVLEGLLERWGCEVTLAHDGAEATRILTSRGFDLVLMDIQMPLMDGYEATRTVRSRPGPSQSVPVIAVTAHARPSDQSRCIEAGMNGHVAKPVQPALLVAAMARALQPRTH